MAQILMILGGLLMIGGGIYQLASGKPVKLKNGRELSRSATLGFSVLGIIVGAAVAIAAWARIL